jgi:para-nitrobenzyl esterase
VHCLDVPFVFDVLDDDHVKVVAGEAPPQSLADEMHGAWVAFLAGTDPGWTPFRVDTPATMVVDETSNVVDDLLGSIAPLWR